MRKQPFVIFQIFLVCFLIQFSDVLAAKGKTPSAPEGVAATPTAPTPPVKGTACGGLFQRVGNRLKARIPDRELYWHYRVARFFRWLNGRSIFADSLKAQANLNRLKDFGSAQNLQSIYEGRLFDSVQGLMYNVEHASIVLTELNDILKQIDEMLLVADELIASGTVKPDERAVVSYFKRHASSIKQLDDTYAYRVFELLFRRYSPDKLKKAFREKDIKGFYSELRKLRKLLENDRNTYAGILGKNIATYRAYKAFLHGRQGEFAGVIPNVHMTEPAADDPIEAPILGFVPWQNAGDSGLAAYPRPDYYSVSRMESASMPAKIAHARHIIWMEILSMGKNLTGNNLVIRKFLPKLRKFEMLRKRFPALYALTLVDLLEITNHGNSVIPADINAVMGETGVDGRLAKLEEILAKKETEEAQRALLFAFARSTTLQELDAFKEMMSKAKEQNKETMIAKLETAYRDASLAREMAANDKFKPIDFVTVAIIGYFTIDYLHDREGSFISGFLEENEDFLNIVEGIVSEELEKKGLMKIETPDPNGNDPNTAPSL